MNDGIFSRSAFSTLKYNGSAVTNRFLTTTVNQQAIMFTNIDGNPIELNSITLEANTADIYFTLIPSPTTTIFTNLPVLFCPAGEVVTVSGISAYGIKLSNATGASLFVQGSTN